MAMIICVQEYGSACKRVLIVCVYGRKYDLQPKQPIIENVALITFTLRQLDTQDSFDIVSYALAR